MIKKETPLMKQYKAIKKENEDSILFFRLGDFYEMFFEDAKIASKELGITLTSRNKEKGVEVPLAGIPYHSAAQYISKLVSKGYKVAICEQVEDPKKAKGIVKREVVKIITPGTVIDTDSLDENSNNYLLGIEIKDSGAGISYIDITTGEFKTTQFDEGNLSEKIFNEINKIAPKEILIDNVSYEILKEKIEEYTKLNNILLNTINLIDDSEEFLKDYFNIISLESFGINNKKISIEIAGTVLNYILELQKFGEIPVNKLIYVNTKNQMELNVTTQRNLDLIKNNREKNSLGTLLWVLNKTKTSMGGRLLKKVIVSPLIDIDKILERQNNVKYFIDNLMIREEIREELINIYDIERIIGKIVLGTENGRDIIALKKSLKSVIEIKNILKDSDILKFELKDLIEIYELIDSSIIEEPPFSIREGKIIKENYNKELDELRNISKQGKKYILDLEKEEKEKTGIKSLKVKYNRVFGYYIEVTKSNIDLVPENYIRKQTLSNAERFITPELKEYESKVLNAKDKIEELEYKIFKEITSNIKNMKKTLQDVASKIANLDMIISFAVVAIENNYIKPEIDEGFEIDIQDARHAVVEKLIGSEDYVSNNIKFTEKEKLIILTGPNMAGKSTYMKQIALIIILAQIGSYVPATYAKIGVVDKIFTRVGASDDLVSGQSTFMVEMSEVANIVNNATERSFVILDEVGRGTSTFDGISIAWAISEYIHDKVKSKTIFATHYHELTELEKKFENIVNFRIEVKETSNSVIFLRKIVRGGADKSYGIEVAKLAGIPNDIINRSKKILFNLEKRRKLVESTIQVEQLSLFGNNDIIVEEEEKVEDEILIELEELNLNNITPLEALNKLNEIKRKIENRK
ncbi:DNA mismatch repair protein MutS [Haliovirga abyssi]|uniref:DNA mismatch repair protein MutS n=1 Tax=Haliovirga abyssi TaxID=2996794 RepID=A0AAU9DLF7_9FUSO|nr:DNA mismatch repair protein MutS [Haliovirga abyssi]BDU50787.1 DNA mismatch repair protein MutS [Haliovirga abyssi]